MKKIYSLTFLLMAGLLPSVAFAQQTAGCPTITSTQSPVVCAGESFTVGTHTYSTSDTYVDTLHAVNGCDSIVTTDLTVSPPVETGITVMIPTCGCPSAIHVDTAAAYYQWLNCTTNTIVDSGVFYQDYAVIYQGTYSVILTNSYGCIDTSECVYVIATGITDLEMQLPELNLYPNPASDDVSLDFYNNAETPLRFSLVNVLGASVYGLPVAAYSIGRNSISLPVKDISNGVYILNISDGKNTLTKRLVVNH